MSKKRCCCKKLTSHDLTVWHCFVILHGKLGGSFDQRKPAKYTFYVEFVDMSCFCFFSLGKEYTIISFGILVWVNAALTFLKNWSCVLDLHANSHCFFFCGESTVL